ncbi:MAG: glycosyltransferase family 4 protein [Ilumatobacteraceae bacterium]
MVRPDERRPGPLRVGMFSPYSLTIPGGVQMQVIGLARALRRMGIEVRVLGPCDGPPPETFVTPLGKSLPTAANGSIAPLAPDPAATMRTIRALRDEQFDVLHIHEPYVPGPTMTALIVHPAPVVATFHAAGHSTSYDVFEPVIRAWSRNITHQVVVSKDALALVSAAAPGDYEMLFNGVDLPLYCGVDAHPTDGPTVFFCGRHEERKGLDVLLRAMAHLGPEVRLWVGGTGPDSAQLRAAYAGDPRIEWLGRLTEPDKIASLKGAHVFCAPSLHGESFGVVLIEAMASHTAIVASSLDGYRNVATDGLDALLVEPGDVDGLAEALRRVLEDPLLAEGLRVGGDRRARTFSMESLAARYAEIYRHVVATGERRSAWRLRASLWHSRLRRMMSG